MNKFRAGQEVYVKAEEIKALIRLHCGEYLTTKEIEKVLGRLCHHRYHGSKLGAVHQEVKEKLEEQGINPKTAYNWVRATLIPDEVQNLIKANKISPTKAFQVLHNRKMRQRASVGLHILESGRRIVEGL